MGVCNGYDEIKGEKLSEKHQIFSQDSGTNSTDDRYVTCNSCTGKVSLSHIDQIEKIALYGQFSDEDEVSHWLKGVNCLHCKTYVSLYVKQVWWTVEELLTSSDNKNGLYEITCYADRIVLFILSQVLYPRENRNNHPQMTFLCPSQQENAKIMWKDGKAVGFYTIKLKGTWYSGSQCDTYEMGVVDLVYVRPEFRRQGLALQMVEDIVKEVPDPDVGFSYPISVSMNEVLCKYLRAHSEWRDHMWECKFTGGPGDRCNIWLNNKRSKRKRIIQQTSESSTSKK